MQGKRLPDAVLGVPGEGWDAWATAEPGSYMKVTQRSGEGEPMWYIVAPDGMRGTLVHGRHEVVEDADGAITVSPSILYDASPRRAIASGEAGTSRPGWHGYLRAGVWSEC